MRTLSIDDVAQAALLLKQGGLVAFPTETVYGLGVDATNSAAVERLFAAKGRPSDNPLIVHVAAVDAWPLAARQLTPSARVLLDAFAPGPLTVVLPKNAAICRQVTAGLDTVGLRIPACSRALELLQAVDRPIAAPSANRSGRPSCTNAASVLDDLEGRIDAVLSGTVSQVGIESTVVDCCQGTPVLLRPGAITLEQLRSVIPEIAGHRASAADESKSPRAPGMKHPHYRPQATVCVVDSSAEIGRLLPDERPHTACAVLHGQVVPLELRQQLRLYREYATLEEYAHNFYEFLREADRLQCRQVYIELAPEGGLGTALRDRQLRAAGRQS